MSVILLGTLERFREGLHWDPCTSVSPISLLPNKMPRHLPKGARAPSDFIEGFGGLPDVVQGNWWHLGQAQSVCSLKMPWQAIQPSSIKYPEAFKCVLEGVWGVCDFIEHFGWGFRHAHHQGLKNAVIYPILHCFHMLNKITNAFQTHWRVTEKVQWIYCKVWAGLPAGRAPAKAEKGCKNAIMHGEPPGNVKIKCWMPWKALEGDVEGMEEQWARHGSMEMLQDQ